MEFSDHEARHRRWRVSELDDADRVEQARLMIGCAWFAIIAGVACALVILAVVIGFVLVEVVRGGGA